MGEPMSLWSLLTERGRGVTYRSVGNPRASTPECLVPAWMMNSPQLPRWSPHFSGPFPDLHLLRPQGHVQLGKNYIRRPGNLMWWPMTPSPPPSSSTVNKPDLGGLLQEATVVLMNMSDAMLRGWLSTALNEGEGSCYSFGGLYP